MRRGHAPSWRIDREKELGEEDERAGRRRTSATRGARLRSLQAALAHIERLDACSVPRCWRAGGAPCGQWRYLTSPVAKDELFKRRVVFVVSFALFKTLARPARLNAATSADVCHPPAPATRGVNIKLMSPVVSDRIATTHEGMVLAGGAPRVRHGAFE
ncbi:hypothetical protein T492DRAFT_1100001 [Pavlovales sp. CCMP2436]|nr:hypothetical protein T492DRAFT_1100001 [Pavlovales sp. CCMP2436]